VAYLNDPASGASAKKHSIGGGTWQDAIFAEGQRIGVRTQNTSPAATTFQYFIPDHLGSV
jgi:hypothetical protein